MTEVGTDLFAGEGRMQIWDCLTGHPPVLAPAALGVLSLFTFLLMFGFQVRHGDTQVLVNNPRLPARSRSCLSPFFLIVMFASLAAAISLAFWYYQRPEIEKVSLVLDQQQSDQECWRRPAENVLVPGERYSRLSGFVQCLSAVETTQRSFRYVFDLSSDVRGGSRIAEFEGRFFIDKAGGAHQESAVVTWDIFYNGKSLCKESVRVSWNQIGHCSMEQEVTTKQEGTIEVVEHVIHNNPEKKLWAVLLDPVLVVKAPC